MPAHEVAGLVLFLLLVAILAACGWLAHAVAEADRITRHEDDSL